MRAWRDLFRYLRLQGQLTAAALCLLVVVLVTAALDNAMSSKVLNSTTSATAFTTLTTGFKIRLASGTSTASAAGTELAGSGYTAGGQTSTAPFASTSAAGSAVTIPNTAILSWVNGSGGGWSIQSLDLTDGAGVRTYYGNWNGAPVAVANGNTFQVAVNAISIADN